ncbi:hypothetical protein BJX63DRAFT_377681 [Aspergillus granulosus]|uniref:Uncharacterized protein n=1 Tax=Aspergillus granulosus TaxID=176169 RepID=A0ABR4I3U6_9EURO
MAGMPSGEQSHASRHASWHIYTKLLADNGASFMAIDSRRSRRCDWERHRTPMSRISGLSWGVLHVKRYLLADLRWTQNKLSNGVTLSLFVGSLTVLFVPPGLHSALRTRR